MDTILNRNCTMVHLYNTSIFNKIYNQKYRIQLSNERYNCALFRNLIKVAADMSAWIYNTICRCFLSRFQVLNLFLNQHIIHVYNMLISGCEWLYTTVCVWSGMTLFFFSFFILFLLIIQHQNSPSFLIKEHTKLGWWFFSPFLSFDFDLFYILFDF